MTSLPTTKAMREFCVLKYLAELQHDSSDWKHNTRIEITHTDTSWICQFLTTYKKVELWSATMTFSVREYDQTTLQLESITITSGKTKDLHIVFKYNNDPTSMQYRFGQYTGLQVKHMGQSSWLLLVVALLKDAWVHKKLLHHIAKTTHTIRPRKSQQSNHKVLVPNVYESPIPILADVTDEIEKHIRI